MGGGRLKGGPKGHSLPDEGGSAGQALRSATSLERECHGLLDAVQGYLFVVDPTLCIKVLNRPPFGLHREAFMGRPITEVVAPEHRYFLKDALKQVIQGALESRIQVQDVRDRRWYDVRIVAVNEDGARECALHALSIEEAKQLELERMKLQARVRDRSYRRFGRDTPGDVERRLSLLADSLDVLISYIDRQCRYRYHNAAYRRWTGQEHSVIIGRSMRAVLGDEIFERVRTYVDAAFSGRSVEFEHSVPHPVAGVRRVAVRYVPDVTSDGQIAGFYSIVQDITQRREAEAAQRRREMELRGLQRTEALGRLAGGIAHEFRNVLQTVITGCTVIQRTAAPDSATVRQAALIERSARRAESLTQQLLSFSQNPDVAPAPLDLHSLLVDIGQMLERLLGQNVQLELDLTAREPVIAEPGQIQQVLLNLALNARDAMLHGGTLRLASKHLHLSSDQRRPGELLPGDYTLITISDTGSGMDEHTRKHAFDPFFTTKEHGKGTGLGLSTVYGIVQRLSGHIEFDSAPGQGTTFRVYLPLPAPPPDETIH